MSSTIQARRYSPSQAALLQRRPSELIQAVESTIDAMAAAMMASAEVILMQGAFSRIIAKNALRLPVEQSDVDARVVDDWTKWAGQTNEAFRKAHAEPRPQTSAAARLRVERLSSLQASFGFTIQDLAAVLSITRPQLYKWLDAANDIKLHEASRARLAMVERLAKEWTTRSHAPLSSVSKEQLVAGSTVFALLSAAVIDETAVIAAFDELVGKLEERPKSRSQRLREAGFTRRPSVRSLPSDE